MAKNTSVKVFDFAVKMEQDGEKFYRSLAAKSADKGVKFILNGLADDEVKHAKVLRELEKGASPAMKQTEILAGSKNVFSDMASRKAFPAAGSDQMALYEQALEMERKSRDYYKTQADDAALKPARELLLLIAGEESRHMFLLESMIEFISRPQTWLENAEFNHLEDY
ncbi:MAG: ferritin family protein [Elusimicrobia bacterium]|nr:ferritin family protein [Elusimicrobiota bacterium]